MVICTYNIEKYILFEDRKKYKLAKVFLGFK